MKKQSMNSIFKSSHAQFTQPLITVFLSVVRVLSVCFYRGVQSLNTIRINFFHMIKEPDLLCEAVHVPDLFRVSRGLSSCPMYEYLNSNLPLQCPLSDPNCDMPPLLNRTIQGSNCYFLGNIRTGNIGKMFKNKLCHFPASLTVVLCIITIILQHLVKFEGGFEEG